jgi:SAM-dependent methyltransferase
MSENATGDGLDAADQRRTVRERYATIAANASTDDVASGDGGDGGEDAATDCCGGDDTSCCGGGEPTGDEGLSTSMGYSESELDAVASGANLGLGCGNPTAIASLDAGETVLDLGSGAGFDCFLAARQVGPSGRVLGVDMTPAMVERARENVADNDVDNVEFRLGEIEHLPVADGVVDVVISNCVVNLSPNKSQVFREAYRVLRPGGRLAISDVVETAPMPGDVRADPESVAACVAGASTVSDLEAMLEAAGFVDVAVEPTEDSEEVIREWDDDRDVSEYVVSATIEGRKPTT